MLRKINYTKFDNQYLVDYSYKNLKSIDFVKEREYNYLKIIFWSNEDRLTMLKFILVYNHMFYNVLTIRKSVIFRYSAKAEKKYKKDKNFLNILLPIIDIDIFIITLLSFGKFKVWFNYKEDNNKKKKEEYKLVFLHVPFKGYKLKWTFPSNGPLFENYIYYYISYIMERESDKHAEKRLMNYKNYFDYNEEKEDLIIRKLYKKYFKKLEKRRERKINMSRKIRSEIKNLLIKDNIDKEIKKEIIKNIKKMKKFNNFGGKNLIKFYYKFWTRIRFLTVFLRKKRLKI